MKACLSFALDAEGRTVSIADVPSGLACNCTCPGCGEPLVAKKGKKLDHHFSHKSDSDCASGYETSLHLAVKTILQRTKQIMLPDCVAQHAPQERQVFGEAGLRTVSEVAVSYPEHDPRLTWKYTNQFDKNYPRNGYGVVRGGLVTFDRVAVEQREGNIIPDLIGYIKDRLIYIEVAVTHFVDDVKMDKLRKHDVSTIELDFSRDAGQVLSWEALENRLLTDKRGSRWLWNQRANILADQDRQLREHRMKPYLDELAKHEVTHRSVFDTGGMHEIRVVLCPSYVGVTVVGELRNSASGKNFVESMKAARAVYDKPTNQWRLGPATEEYWLRVEGVLRKRYREKDGAWTLRVPPGEEQRIDALMRGNREYTELHTR